MLSRDFRIQKSAAAAEKAETVDTTPHELTNIRVQEVSVVDSPANRKKFLITKRDKNTEKGVVRVILADGSDAPWAELDRADAARAKGEVPPEKAAADLVVPSETAPPVKDDVPTKEEPVVEEPAKEEPVVEEPAKEEPKVEPPAIDPDKTPGVVTEPPVKVEEDITAKAGEVAKVGRPMQRARLDRLKAAWKTVTDILGELDGDETDKAADKVAAPAPAPAPVVIVDTVKADANAAEIKRLSTMVETLQKMVKEQGVELAKSKQPVDSNTISLEKSKFDHDKVIWDNDMASHSARVRGRSL
jgi:hypothetical protein